MKNNTATWIIGALLLVALTVGAVVLIGQQRGHTPVAPQPQNQQTPPNTSGGSDKTVTITYTNDGFAPATYTIAAGGIVTVVNNSSRDLEFSSDNHPTHRAEPELNMSTLQPGQSGTFTVTKTGTWGFHNHLNAQDTGRITVR